MKKRIIDPVDDAMRGLVWSGIGILASCVIVTFLIVVLIVVIPVPKDKRLWTIEANGKKYENLTFDGWGANSQVFKTQDGKRIEAHGTFVRVEQ